MPCGALGVLDFSEQLILEKLGSSYAAQYLFEYLTAIQAKSAICEEHYVDRHYLDDFAQYYSRSFNAPVPYCQRLHFFSITCDEVNVFLDAACVSSQERNRIEQVLCDYYLGFVVVRPLVGAKVGRTVLKTYPLNGLRRYTVSRSYRVHLAGLRFTVDGLAYQEQDQGTAVCASIALWSALQRVAYVSGHRTPTPSAITKAAKSPYPASSGLNDSQMATALNSLGYLADLFVPAENRAQFRAKVVACLESQLPVILLLSQQQQTGAGEVTVGHAITVTGFQESKKIVEVPTSVPGTPAVTLKSGSLEVVYVHDDNLGPHAHYELFDVDEKDSEGYKLLKLRRGSTAKTYSSGSWPVDEWTVYAALVPKNEKMRLSVEELFSNLLEIRRYSELIFQGLELNYGVRFASGVEYKRSLFNFSFEPLKLRQFLAEITLPRYVGVVQVNTGDQHLCDAILDISEVNRGNPSVLGFIAPGVPENSVAWQRLVQIVHFLNQYSKFPLITAPITY
jgi:Papain-like cysteine protease AvrRpt2